MEMISVCFQCSVYWLMSVPLYNSAASIVSSSIQPLQNLSILKYIEEKGGPDEKLAWVKYHIGKGFTALEKLLKDYAGQYATGDEVFLADLFIAPQVDAAIKRFNLDMECLPEEKSRLISELELSS